MILGRNAGLWLGLVAAGLNAAVVVLGLNLNPEQLAALNALALAFVGVLANEADPTTLGTFDRSMTGPLPPEPAPLYVPAPEFPQPAPPAVEPAPPAVDPAPVDPAPTYAPAPEFPQPPRG